MRFSVAGSSNAERANLDFGVPKGAGAAGAGGDVCRIAVVVFLSDGEAADTESALAEIYGTLGESSVTTNTEDAAAVGFFWPDAPAGYSAAKVDRMCKLFKVTQMERAMCCGGSSKAPTNGAEAARIESAVVHRCLSKDLC
jgi:hypothetical protein